MVVDERYVLLIPKGLDHARAAPLMCAGITTYSPLGQFGCKRGDHVAVVGLGGVGHLGVKLAVPMRADATVLSPLRDNEEAADRLGANRCAAARGPGALEPPVRPLGLLAATV